MDDDLVLTESAAVVLYLAEKYHHKGLMPTDFNQRAQVNRWLLFTVTELEQPLWRIARHTTLYPAQLRLPAEVSLARQDFIEMAAVMEQYVQERKFMVGNTLTVADIVAAHTLDWANEVQLLDDFPLLLRYMKRLYDRPKAPPRISEAFASLNL